uniref:HMA domain-containing protein n=1 Tax=Oryza glumipatula TaxID=40148 RepID=A0A0D9Z8U7_9ORYZ
MSTIVMMVDLECDRCYRKIRRVLCKLQDKASIKAISYDEKNNTVTVAGPFDADEVSDRLCSSAGKVITDIRVVGGAKPMPGGGAGGAKAHANKPAGKDGGAGGGGGGGGKPEMIKKHVKFEMADDMDDHHHHHDNRKPKVVTTTNHAAGALARMEGRRAEAPSMAMAAAMAPAPMPMTVQATATPSIRYS